MIEKRALLAGLRRFYRSIVIGESGELELKQRLIILTSLIMTFFGLISMVTNYLLGFGPVMVGLMAVIAVLFFSYYLVGRFNLMDRKIYMLISLTFLVIINIAWFYNYGSRGPVFLMFIILYTFYIFIWEKRMLLVVSVVLLINVLVLFLLEWQNPNFTGNYPDESLRISDVYLGLFIAILLILAFALTVKLNYMREYAQARKSDQLKSAFLANMSHEIRTPLNAIVGFSSLVSDDVFDQEQKDEFKRMINENSDYLMFLIEDIIDLSKIEVGALQFKMSEVSLDELFEKLKQSFGRSPGHDRKQLHIHYQLQLDNPTISTDVFRLEQILRNLINNAIKFTEQGEVEFGVEQRDGEITFYVKDSGIGIRPENIEIIFDRFVKVEERGKNMVRGTGIGLFLSKQLIEKLGGRIWVESEYGHGTTFYFTINHLVDEKAVF
ncbi:sensor histidine kinase [Sunxiuqinia dokdonensis]|uniref:histidine kinase n=1 Tax=Sunxiuqinia dokdonensis TaxID=1409788 RepID=A0A0L8VEN1_9BACT|nr:ATP-binding protein [Sunxiuqinia dokdonensis]KOH46622.1 histidine kinase [Sunxiuqinia dokdonensis]